MKKLAIIWLFCAGWLMGQAGQATAVAPQSPAAQPQKTIAQNIPPSSPQTAAGTNIYLPLIMKSNASPVPTSGQSHDLARFLSGGVGNGILYEIHQFNGSQTRFQLQITPTRIYHTKGENVGEWEELWVTDTFIYRGTDTSPGDINGDGRSDYYTLRENNQYGSKWAPRIWRVGELFERNPTVTFYSKDNCVPFASGPQRSWLRFDAYYPTYTFASGITLNNVIQLSWLLTPDGNPIEQYYYAEGYGLVQWEGSSTGQSYISEIHAPGQRPDNPRETIACLKQNGFSPRGLPKPFIWVK
ncbi:MAG: hypothetical protein Kow0080_07380 [Candidatus Promineifilaceae bacterium]